ncbi:fimbrial protein [Erwinia sp. JUb26]|uniref:fimbrial protein n=1 Tax=Erwinia sp. JUb26 TaxID=2485126 RepID=UPI000F93FC46|nr:type 1 fimbria pilin [Erwinia sp. JUb26]
MNGSVSYLTLKKIVQMMLLGCGVCVFSSQGQTPFYDDGRIDFRGRVSDTSCSVALNGSNNAGSGNIWLAPVSLSEVHQRGAGAFMKPQPFTLELSKCQLNAPGAEDRQMPLPVVSVRWITGVGMSAVNNDSAEYLDNILPDGARNIYLALATNDGSTLAAENKIVPADPQQNQVQMQGQSASSGILTYYIGYVTTSPQQVTSGPISSLATLELVYN